MTVFTETLSGLWLVCTSLCLFCVPNQGLGTSLLLWQYYSGGHRFSFSFFVLADASHVAPISPKSDLGGRETGQGWILQQKLSSSHSPEQEVFWGTLLQIPTATFLTTYIQYRHKPVQLTPDKSTYSREIVRLWQLHEDNLIACIPNSFLYQCSTTVYCLQPSFISHLWTLKQYFHRNKSYIQDTESPSLVSSCLSSPLLPFHPFSLTIQFIYASFTI